AGAVKARRPATMPISSASNAMIMIALRNPGPFSRPPASRSPHPLWLLRHVVFILPLFEKVSDRSDRGRRLLFHQPMVGIGDHGARHVGRDKADVVRHCGVEGFLRADRQYRISSFPLASS